MNDNNKYLATVEDNLLTIRPLWEPEQSWFIIVAGSSYSVFQTEQDEKEDAFHIQDFDNITDAIELAITL